VPGVGAVALGALLGPAARRHLGRLGQMDLSANRPEFFDDEPPSGRRLQRDLELLAAETAGEPSHASAVSRRDPLPR